MRKVLIVLIMAIFPGMSAMAGGQQFGQPGFPGSEIPSAVTWKKTCAQIQGLVNSSGAAVLTYKRHGVDTSNLLTVIFTMGNSTYDRVVKDQSYCLVAEGTQPIWVRTRDVPQCFAGYTCESNGDRGGRNSR